MASDLYYRRQNPIKAQQAISHFHPQRLVFNMKYFDGLKYEQIAEILNTSVGGLKANYHHAVKD
jgi:RNA polymerase sigma-70 factor (ECF subfamily)